MKQTLIHRIVAAFILLLIAAPAIAQETNTLTLENLWLRYRYMPTYWSADARHMNDGQHYSVLEDNAIYLYNYTEGVITDTVAGVDAFGDFEVSDFSFSANERRILLESESERIYRHSSKAFFSVYDRDLGKLSPVSDPGKGKQRLADFSPDGSKVAFVRDNNIFWVDLASGMETQVTSDGEINSIINGTCDWVYEEEFSFTKGFEWSPDGKYIAFYRFDESEVREWSMTIYGELYPEKQEYKYPKAGEDNSKVSIHIYNVQSRKTVTVDTGDETDIYIPRIKWTYAAGKLAVMRLNRLQNHLEILLADAGNGSSSVMYSETNERYIEITDDFYFLKDNSGFILTSEADGFNHIYYFDMQGKVKSKLTVGDYDVTEVKGVDEAGGRVFYIAAESSPLNREICSVKLNGKGKKTLSGKPGTWDAEFNATFSYYFGDWSDANTPPTFAMYDRNGKMLRVMEDNSNLIAMLKEQNAPGQEFFSFTTTENVVLNGSMIKPPDFDANKEYPVLMYVYGGPNSQTVANQWDPFNGIWFRLLAQKGYVIVSVDNRGTGARGEDFRKLTYQQLGKYETMDQIEGAKYLGGLSWVDKDRIGIFGWSYGGFMTTLCMTKGADYFSTGIAVAPVTNWRFYDNIYTERYMRRPQENAAGYDDNSPINHVKKMKGNYLLVHGTADDNVHVENAYDLVTALVNANKQFEMQFYPNRNHSIFGGYTRYHLYTRMTNYILENL